PRTAPSGPRPPTRQPILATCGAALQPSRPETATTTATPRAAEPFLKALLRSRLLSAEEIQTFVRSVPAASRASSEALAEEFIKAGKLSKFQATKLLQGTAGGLVLGPFQVLAPIGKGGMGTVYLSRDQRSDQLVALKVLSPKRAREEP